VIGLDTNILVRYLADDDRTQSPKAAALIQSFTRETPGFISLATMLETVWVMESLYGSTRDEVVSIITRLLQAESFRVESSLTLRAALRVYANGKADFADCVIAESSRSQGATQTMTFDKLAARDAGMMLLR
jgi:predicted nucleic-acid-binding protein